MREFYLKSNESVHTYKKKDGKKIYLFNEQGVYFYLFDSVKALFDFLKRGEPCNKIIEGERALDKYLGKICQF